MRVKLVRVGLSTAIVLLVTTMTLGLTSAAVGQVPNAQPGATQDTFANGASVGQRDNEMAETYPELDRWASVFAMRQVSVQCPGPEAWGVDEVARDGWAYVPLGPPMTAPASHAVAAPPVCGGALAVAGRVSAERWQMALGVLTLLHEAYHLRIWRHRLDEGRVNCQAIRHVKVGVRLLGGSRQLADDLLPYALSIYWRLAVKTPAYHWERCRVPGWWP
jgi:hypothetical protein